MAIILEPLPQETKDTEMNSYILFLGAFALVVFIVGTMFPGLLR